MKLLPLPVNDASDGRSIPFPSSVNSTLHYHRIVVVVGILINRLSTVVTNKRPIVHFDGLKLRKTYSSYYTLNNTNQGEWWRSIETLLTNINRLKRSEVRHLKWLGILECIVTQSNRLKLGKSFASVHLLSPTNQSEWVGGIETILTNLNRFKRFQLCQFKGLCWLECLVAETDRP